MRNIKIIFSVLIFIFFINFLLGNFCFAAEDVEINFFYSDRCPHCAAEKIFLKELEIKYPEIEINYHSVTDPASLEVFKKLCEKCAEAEKYLGLVPLTFVEDDFFPGFDDEKGIGKKIEDSIQKHIEGFSKDNGETKKTITLPIIGRIDIDNYSLPLQTIILGFFDGFNVCSLGALVLILGLVLALRSRFKIFLFGGIFILITAIIYGILIFLWYQLFNLLVSYMKMMQALIGLLGVGGGFYFLKEFIKFRKQGPVCEMGNGGLISNLSSKMQELMKNPRSTVLVITSIIGFAAIITIVEFPCSAVVPVLFAGILANSGISGLEYLLYIALFVFFYMFDEVLIFLVACFTMNIWFASPKFVTWLTLAEAFMFFVLGFYYLIGF